MDLSFRTLLARLRRPSGNRTKVSAFAGRPLALEGLEDRTVPSQFGSDLLSLAKSGAALPPVELSRPFDPNHDCDSTGLLSEAAEFSSVALGGARTTGLYESTVILRGLVNPTGITATRLNGSNALFFTQLPEPGVPGGTNTVSRMSLLTSNVTNLTVGEPEPTNIVQDAFGNLYWTCHSANVILTMNIDGDVRLLLRDLASPVGIAVDPAGETLYFTEVPTPGVGGGMGGMNRVSKLDLTSGETTVIDTGDPEPTDIVLAPNGDLYWTCRSAGVIVRYDGSTGETGVILRDLQQPVGIAMDEEGHNLFFTELPTPGVPGSMGGENRVSRMSLGSQEIDVVDFGDPQPTDVTVGRDGTVFWTCTSAGVIVAAQLR